MSWRRKQHGTKNNQKKKGKKKSMKKKTAICKGKCERTPMVMHQDETFQKYNSQARSFTNSVHYFLSVS